MKFKDDYQEPYNAENMRPILPPEEQIEKAAEAFSNLAKTIQEKLMPTIQALIEKFMTICNEVFKNLKTYPNKRVVHLALHGKPRVRKKNIKRIKRWMERNTDGL